MDLRFKETCSCGATIEVSGYASTVQTQIASWKKTHNPHGNAVIKKIAENRAFPPYRATFTEGGILLCAAAGGDEKPKD